MSKRKLVYLSGIGLVLILMVAVGITYFLRRSDIVSQSSDIKAKSEATSDEVASLAEDKNEDIKLLFFGDLMLDRDVRTQIQKKGVDSLADVKQEMFTGYDLNIANLEGPITGNNSVSVGTAENEKGHFKFTFDPATADSVLKNLRIGAVSLGNNHILNFGTPGLAETKNNLDSSGVRYFGEGGAGDYLLQEIGGRKIALISYNAFSSGNWEKAVAQINETKNKVDAVIIYAHWGSEYALAENENQWKLAHQFIDAGADFIIGSHPHVVQSIEIYNGKPIFYSLGNFIFDQYFSEDVRERLAVGVSIGKDSFDFYLVPLYLEKKGELVMMDEARRAKFLGRIAGNSMVDDNVKNSIKEGKFSVE